MKHCAFCPLKGLTPYSLWEWDRARRVWARSWRRVKEKFLGLCKIGMREWRKTKSTDSKGQQRMEWIKPLSLFSQPTIVIQINHIDKVIAILMWDSYYKAWFKKLFSEIFFLNSVINSTKPHHTLFLLILKTLCSKDCWLISFYRGKTN